MSVLVGMQPLLTQVPPSDLALDERGLAAALGEAHRQRRPGLAGADDDGVEAFGHGFSRWAARKPRDTVALPGATLTVRCSSVAADAWRRG